MCFILVAVELELQHRCQICKVWACAVFTSVCCRYDFTQDWNTSAYFWDIQPDCCQWDFYFRWHLCKAIFIFLPYHHWRCKMHSYFWRTCSKVMLYVLSTEIISNIHFIILLIPCVVFNNWFIIPITHKMSHNCVNKNIIPYMIIRNNIVLLWLCRSMYISGCHT